MMQLDRMILGRKAKEMGFVRDVLEKVCPLAAVLKFMEEDELLANSIALKGGTAINLTIFNLPRLSVDIDLDYCKNVERDANVLLGAEQPPVKFDMSHIGEISAKQIKRDLNPVLRRGERFDLDVAKKEVRDYLTSVMKPTEAEVRFWTAFADGVYCPVWIFGESSELQNISNHPMALWKCGKIQKSIFEQKISE